MTPPSAFVFIELEGRVRPVGRLWSRRTSGQESASFEYDPEWLQAPLRFALGPALPTTRGAFHTGEGRSLFGALGDSAPDRWGRRLIARNEARRARVAGGTPRAMREIDYLLGVTDASRQGALRFRITPDGPFVALPSGVDQVDVPPLIELPELLHAARTLAEDTDTLATDQAISLLLAPGSSLGGARPKASVRDRDGSLAIAKFPDAGDEHDVIRWEFTMMRLAERAGITVSAASLQPVGDAAVLLLRRFDRLGSLRVPFLSAMSLLDATDGQRRSYVEIFDALRQVASQPKADGEQLWRRLAFNILASNFDDHLRNHAVLYDGEGWRLSPAYDLNPVPGHLQHRALSTTISLDDDPSASIELAVEASEEFLLKPPTARAIAVEVANALRDWQQVARSCGVAANQLDPMASAFEHEEANVARSWR